MDAPDNLAESYDEPAPTGAEVVPPSDLPLSDLPLSERELAILEFERHWWRHAGSKEQAIRDRFSLSPTRYYQLLNALIDNPVALEHDPMLVKRLRRLRASRSRARTARHPK